MEEHGFVHKSVLLYETVGSLNIKPGGIYVDGTLGGGGHAMRYVSGWAAEGSLELTRMQMLSVRRERDWLLLKIR